MWMDGRLLLASLFRNAYTREREASLLAIEITHIASNITATE
jgi:hypothetical protein